MSNQNGSKTISQCNQRITALSKLVSPKTPIKLGSQSMKLSDLLAVYQACIDTRTEAGSKRVAYAKALDARDAADQTRLAIDERLRAWADFQFGLDSQEAADLGFAPRKVGVRSAATKAAAAEKLVATRAARKTMGKRQREKVKAPDAPEPTPPPTIAEPQAANGAAH